MLKGWNRKVRHDGDQAGINDRFNQFGPGFSLIGLAGLIGVLGRRLGLGRGVGHEFRLLSGIAGQKRPGARTVKDFLVNSR
jgi:hypothetical protein